MTESSPPRADGIRPAPCGRGPARCSADRGLPRIAPFFKDGPDRTHLAVDPLLLRFQLAEGLSQGSRNSRLIPAFFRGTPFTRGATHSKSSASSHPCLSSQDISKAL